jgi:hypothetical protein
LIEKRAVGLGDAVDGGLQNLFDQGAIPPVA